MKAIQEFEERLSCVPRILSARNARMGSPVSATDLEDLVQDTLVLIWRKLPTFEGRSSLETWIYRICSLELMNAIRRWKRGRRRRVSDSEAALGEHRSREQDPSSHIHYQDLYKGLESLPPEEEQVVRLKHYDELTFEQIGKREGMSAGRAKARYYAGIQHLRRILRRDWSDEVAHE